MNFVRKYSMMMLLLSGAMTIVSCSNDAEEFQKVEDGEITFLAGMPGVESDTRTILDENDQPLWHKKDHLYMFSNRPGEKYFAMTTDNNLLPAKTANFKIDIKDQNRFNENKEMMDWVAAFHGPESVDMTSNGILLRNGNGSTINLKRQTIKRNNINGSEDLLISRKVDAKEIATTKSNELRFKRLNGIMKIKFVDETGGLLPAHYKIKKGWITTGPAVPTHGQLPTSGIYKDNNFAGSAYIGMEEGSANEYKLTKQAGKCSGIEFTMASGDNYMYDFDSEEDYLYISVYPTKLVSGECFTIGFGDGTNTAYVNKTINIDNTFEIKGCHIHEITVKIQPSDVIRVLN